LLSFEPSIDSGALFPVQATLSLFAQFFPTPTRMSTTDKTNNSLEVALSNNAQPTKVPLFLLLRRFAQRLGSISLTSPRTVIAGGCLELIAILYFFSRVKILEGDYFRFGPPLRLFQYEITSEFDFLLMLGVFFAHQVCYTWITETINPWLLNEVQDQKCPTIRYSKPTTLWVINLYTSYVTVNTILILNVAFSQLSFLFVVILADIISTTSLNLSYIWNKSVCDKTEQDLESQVWLKGYTPIPTTPALSVTTSITTTTQVHTTA